MRLSSRLVSREENCGASSSADADGNHDGNSSDGGAKRRTGRSRAVLGGGVADDGVLVAAGLG